jgi:hypothetical protein
LELTHDLLHLAEDHLEHGGGHSGHGLIYGLILRGAPA